MEPSTESMAELRALYEKYCNLADHGRFLRAKEVIIEATALAERVLPPDSLVLARVLFTRSRNLAGPMLATSTADDEERHKRAKWRLYDAALTEQLVAGKSADNLAWLPLGLGIMWRRHADGTLSRQRPHEKAWERRFGHLVGTLLGCFEAALGVAFWSHVPDAIRAAFVSDAVRLWLRAAQDGLRDAALSGHAECIVSFTYGHALARVALEPAADAAPIAAELGMDWAAWQRIRNMLRLSARERVAALAVPTFACPEGDAAIAANVNPALEVMRARIRADRARFALRRCALPSCSIKEPHPKAFKLCGRCRAAVYCCADHQREDWRRHKREDGCKAPDAGGAGP